MDGRFLLRTLRGDGRRGGTQGPAVAEVSSFGGPGQTDPARQDHAEGEEQQSGRRGGSGLANAAEASENAVAGCERPGAEACMKGKR